jgi:Flp pilus assembly protein TadD
MELIKGVPITKYCDEHRLTPKERLGLFVHVCQAVQHAHQKGIIHRDLKPSNVLIALYDGRPVPKVIDFGVAKATGPELTERTLYTEFGSIVGTLEYMSPEQAELNQLDVDTRSDVYSLGVLLYELLTGTTPLERRRLKESSLLEALRLIREEEPPKPSTRLGTTAELPAIAASRGAEPKKLRWLVRGELDWIVMKALEKDRNRRYETANGLAGDVERYLADEPVQACPPSAAYRFRKFARRNKPALAAAALLAVLVLAAVGAAAGTLGWVAADRAARQTVLEQEVARALEEAASSNRGDRLTEALAAVGRAEELLARGGGGEELQQRVRRWRADLKMAGRLDAIRLEQAVIKDGRFDVSGDPAYREAFRQLDLNVDELNPDEAAERIRGSPIKDRLVAALDDWVSAKWVAGLPGSPELLALARRVDTDPWRDRIREALRSRGGKALVGWARDEEALSQPPATLLLLGAALRQTGQVSLAVEVLRQAQQQHPDDFWINQNLAFYLMQTKPARADEAVAFYRAALALRAECPGIHLNLGYALQAGNKLVEAEGEFRKALGFRPGDAATRRGLVNVLIKQNKAADVEAVFQEAVRLKPEDATTQHDLGTFLIGQGRPAEAQDAFRKAIHLQPGWYWLHYALGRAYAESGQWDLAAAAFGQAITIRAADKSYWEYYALTALGAGDPGAYGKACTGLLKEYGHTNDPDTGNTVAWTCVLSADASVDWKRCVALAEKAVASQTDRHAYLNTLGAALYRAGDYATAVSRLEEADRAYGKGGYAADWLFLAMSHHRLGNARESRQWLNKAVSWIDQEEQKLEAGDKPPRSWQRRLELRLLRQEAETLIGGETPD